MASRTRIVLCLLSALLPGVAAVGASPDPRDIHNGAEILSEGYCDQPYIVVLDDGTWLCTLTTGPGEEGATHQHVVSTRSPDRGKTWEPLTSIEPPGPPESSWVTPLKAMGGRVYAFYDYNAENLRSVPLSTGGATKRVDTLGQFVFKYSDDGGRSWSAQRYRIPIRAFEIDRENVFMGRTQFMWSVAKPLVYNANAYIGLSKVGNFGKGFIERSEGVVLVSENVLSAVDPSTITWETLPEGDIGLRAPSGSIAEEQNLTFLSDGSLYCTYRTTQGHPCHAYSRDGGHTWTPPAYMRYSPGGRLFKHPRAANFVRRLSNGKYVYWFHNHAGTGYEGRNPVWISGGIEKDGALHWSQPEILLYDEDPAVRMSYPDFIDDAGRLYVSETQKSIARVHEVPTELLNGLWGQFGAPMDTREGMVLGLTAKQCRPGTKTSMPTLPLLEAGQGFTIELTLAATALADEQILLDARDEQGKGIALSALPNGAVSLNACDNQQSLHFESDSGGISAAGIHKVTVIADGGPRVLLFVVDGLLCDGGDARTQGWYRLPAEFKDWNGRATFRLGGLAGYELKSLRIFTRALRVSEAIGNQRAN